MKWEPFLKSHNRGVCKACNSKYEIIRRYAKDAEKNPNDYMSCHSCDRIFKKYGGGPPDKNGNRNIRTSCPLCKSCDVGEY